ncbi:MAG: polysaccharide pyruvyl transferase family protein [Clostridia bacterium]|nr:polysaccharide pyruvyl transferase family protein [Clostridia bacterium]
MDRKRVLIINCCFTSNFGDQAIGVTVEKLFKENNCDVDLYDIIRVDNKIRSTLYRSKSALSTARGDKSKRGVLRSLIVHFKKSLAATRWKSKNRKMIESIARNKYDIVIIGGGELIQSNRIFSVAIYAWISAVKRFNSNIKIVFFGVGVTDTYTRRDKALFRSSFKHADAFYLRDVNSINNLKSIFGFSSKLIPDVVFGGYDKVYNSSCVSSTVLYGITSFDRIKRYRYKNLTDRKDYYEHVYRELLDIGLSNSALDVKLMYSDIHDFKECHAFSSYIFDVYRMKIEICSYETLLGFEKEVSECKALISPRMHACIFGLIYGKDVRIIDISKKTNAFHKEYLSANVDFVNMRKALMLAINEVLI